MYYAPSPPRPGIKELLVLRRDIMQFYVLCSFSIKTSHQRLFRIRKKNKSFVFLWIDEISPEEEESVYSWCKNLDDLPTWCSHAHRWEISKWAEFLWKRQNSAFEHQTFNWKILCWIQHLWEDRGRLTTDKKGGRKKSGKCSVSVLLIKTLE